MGANEASASIGGTSVLFGATTAEQRELVELISWTENTPPAQSTTRRSVKRQKVIVTPADIGTISLTLNWLPWHPDHQTLYRAYRAATNVPLQVKSDDINLLGEGMRGAAASRYKYTEANGQISIAETSNPANAPVEAVFAMGPGNEGVGAPGDAIRIPTAAAGNGVREADAAMGNYTDFLIRDISDDATAVFGTGTIIVAEAPDAAVAAGIFGLVQPAAQTGLVEWKVLQCPAIGSGAAGENALYSATVIVQPVTELTPMALVNGPI